MKPRRQETVVSALSPSSWSESQFKILIVSHPWPCLDSLFSRNFVKSLCKFCNARSNQRRMLLSGCFWLKMHTNVHVIECSRHLKVCFITEVWWRCRPRAPRRFEVKDVLLCYSLAFRGHSRLLSNVPPSPTIPRLTTFFGLYTFFKEVLNHAMLPQLAIVFIKLCGSLQVSGMVTPKYLDEIKKLAKYFGFVGCGIPRVFEWCQII